MVMLSMVSPVIAGAEAASPQPTWPVLVSNLTSTLSALSMSTPAIFIGFAIGSRTAMASTRLIRAWTASRSGRVDVAVAVMGYRPCARTEAKLFVLVEPANRFDRTCEAFVIGIEKFAEFR